MQSSDITPDQLVVGQYYASMARCGHLYIFKHVEDNYHNTPFICTGPKRYDYGNGSLDGRRNSAFTSYRLATDEEIQWFNACHNARIFIPKDEVIINKEAYAIF